MVDAILQAITSVTGVSLLDWHADTDHNRTVVTVAGAPDAVSESVFRAIQKAAQSIDLGQHTGAHPRIGATDVVPFVPLAETSMEACVNLARHLGERVGRELGLPVYLYEAAATRPERRNLEDIRRGQYEGLRSEIESDPARKPDYGPARLGPAGATVIGARPPLVAFNVYLATGDVMVAKTIAKSIRQSSGGFPCVKALGMMVESRAQVSMNLTDFRQTSLRQVVDAIRREAGRLGTSIHHSELVGLIPQEALTAAAVDTLELAGFQPEQILENRLFTARESQGKDDFLEALASDSPTPGGGSAAAYSGAMAAALAAMVARLTIGKKKYAAVEAQMKEILAQAERLRGELSQAVEEDATAFDRVMAAFKLPRETAAEQEARDLAIETATQQAALVPLKVAQNAVMVLALAERLAALGNLNAITDAGSSAALARASLAAAALNVRTNLANLHERAFLDKTGEQLNTAEGRASQLEHEIQKILQGRAHL